MADITSSMGDTSYVTRGGITIHRSVEEIPVAGAIAPILAALDTRAGVLLASSYEYPGRYTRWDFGFVDPPLELVTRGLEFRLSALNERGQLLLPALAAAVRQLPAVAYLEDAAEALRGAIQQPAGRFAEE